MLNNNTYVLRNIENLNKIKNLEQIDLSMLKSDNNLYFISLKDFEVTHNQNLYYPILVLNEEKWLLNVFYTSNFSIHRISLYKHIGKSINMDFCNQMTPMDDELFKILSTNIHKIWEEYENSK